MVEQENTGATATQSPVVERIEVLLAVAEAADLYSAMTGGHHWRCEFRTAAKGWKRGDPPVIECCCGLDALNAALALLQETAEQSPPK